MTRSTFDELKERRLQEMSASERKEFDEAHAEARLAIEVDERVREHGWRPG